MSSRWPAIVRTIDRARREIRVEIPGLTDGSDMLPLAEIEYPIGDRATRTEIRFIVGDLVWVSFIGGDPRYPIITGFRTKHTGNSVGTRRWEHDNFESIADAIYRVQAGDVVVLDVGSAKVIITKNAQVTLVAESNVQVDSPAVNASGSISAEGNLAAGTGASGSFTTPNGNTVTVQDGIITNIF